MLNVAYNFEELIEIIENKPCLLRLYQIIQYTCNDQTYERTRSAVKTKRGRSEWFETRCGVRQCSVLSPALFNVMSEICLEIKKK